MAGASTLPPPSCPTRTFELLPRPPFRLDLTVWALRRRAQNAVDTWDGSTYRRAIVVDDAPLELAVRQTGREEASPLEVVLSGSHPTPSVEHAARSALTRLLGLDLELSGFYRRASRDSTLGPLAERYQGVKPPRFPTVFECLVNAVACQQLSLSAGLTLVSRLAAAAGPCVGPLHAFPAPAGVLRMSRQALRALGFSEQKSETILALSRSAANGEYELATLESLDDTAVSERLMRQPGIGRWSADYVLLRGLGRLQVFPHRDVGALNGLRSLLNDAGIDAEPQDALARWAQDAGIVYFHLLLRGLERQGLLEAGRLGGIGAASYTLAGSPAREGPE